MNILVVVGIVVVVVKAVVDVISEVVVVMEDAFIEADDVNVVVAAEVVVEEVLIPKKRSWETGG